MDKHIDILLRQIRNIKPIIAEKYGVMIPYGDIFQKTKYHPGFASDNTIDCLLKQLEDNGKLEIIHDPDCPDMLLGVRLK